MASDTIIPTINANGSILTGWLMTRLQGNTHALLSSQLLKEMTKMSSEEKGTDLESVDPNSWMAVQLEVSNVVPIDEMWFVNPDGSIAGKIINIGMPTPATGEVQL